MSLYTLLTAARGRQLLSERGWSEGLDFSATECGRMLTVAGTGVMKRAVWLSVLMTVWSMTKRMSTDGVMSLARTGY